MICGSISSELISPLYFFWIDLAPALRNWFSMYSESISMVCIMNISMVCGSISSELISPLYFFWIDLTPALRNWISMYSEINQHSCICRRYHKKSTNESISLTHWLIDLVSAVAPRNWYFLFLEESFICQSNEITHSIFQEQNDFNWIPFHLRFQSTLSERTFMQLLWTL